jgi:flavodoxin I
MFEVVYYSKGGNTKKVAEAIAAELGVTIGDVTANKEPAEDCFLFLGSGCYAGRPGEEV